MTVSTSVRRGSVPYADARRLVAHATSAPSVHNTQPWRWRISDDTIELYADTTRRLVVEDPVGRNLVISCGSALHHLLVAADALGWTTDVDRVAGTSDPTLLARVRLSPSDRPAARDLLAVLHERRTDRRRFTSWPVPDERLRHLAAEANDQGCQAVALLDETSRVRLQLLAETALASAAVNEAVTAEQDRWVDRGRTEGVPSWLVPKDAADALRNRFGRGLLPEGPSELEDSDGIIVLGGAADNATSWLRTGEGLSALWLMATRGNLSVVPLSQPIEVEQTRRTLRREVLGGLFTPDIVVRIGWQAIGRSDLPPSPRRPVDEVLLP